MISQKDTRAKAREGTDIQCIQDTTDHTVKAKAKGVVTVDTTEDTKSPCTPRARVVDTVKAVDFTMCSGTRDTSPPTRDTIRNETIDETDVTHNVLVSLRLETISFFIVNLVFSIHGFIFHLDWPRIAVGRVGSYISGWYGTIPHSALVGGTVPQQYQWYGTIPYYGTTMHLRMYHTEPPSIPHRTDHAVRASSLLYSARNLLRSPDVDSKDGCLDAPDSSVTQELGTPMARGGASHPPRPYLRRRAPASWLGRDRARNALVVRPSGSPTEG